jgi:hypothetical protein
MGTWKAAMAGKVATGGKPAGGEKHRCPHPPPSARSRMKLWMVRATTTVLLWTCVVQLTAVGETWGPRVLKGWPSCLTAPEEAAAAVRPEVLVEKAATLPPKREFFWSLSRFRSPCLKLQALCLDAVPSRTLTAGQHFDMDPFPYLQCRFPKKIWWLV